MGTYWFEFDFGVEGEDLAIGDEVLEGVAVEVVAVREIIRPVRVGVVRREDRDAPAGFGDAVEFGDEGRRIGHVFDDVVADNLIKFVVGKWLGNDAQIVDHVGVGRRVDVNADGAGMFVAPAADVQNLPAFDRRRAIRFRFRLAHQCVS